MSNCTVVIISRIGNTNTTSRGWRLFISLQLIFLLYQLHFKHTYFFEAEKSLQESIFLKHSTFGCSFFRALNWLSDNGWEFCSSTTSGTGSGSNGDSSVSSSETWILKYCVEGLTTEQIEEVYNTFNLLEPQLKVRLDFQPPIEHCKRLLIEDVSQKKTKFEYRQKYSYGIRLQKGNP